MTRGRVSRQEMSAAHRRRRTAGSLDRMAQFTLDIFAPEQLDPSFVYRWVTDEGSRLRQATRQDDYDLVGASEIADFSPQDQSDSESSERVRMVVGRDKNGAPTYAYLCKKPRAFFEEDQAAVRDFRQAMMEGRVYRGEVGGEEGESADLTAHAYVPESAGVTLGSASARRRGPVHVSEGA